MQPELDILRGQLQYRQVHRSQLAESWVADTEKIVISERKRTRRRSVFREKIKTSIHETKKKLSLIKLLQELVQPENPISILLVDTEMLRIALRYQKDIDLHGMQFLTEDWKYNWEVYKVSGQEHWPLWTGKSRFPDRVGLWYKDIRIDNEGSNLVVSKQHLNLDLPNFDRSDKYSSSACSPGKRLVTLCSLKKVGVLLRKETWSLLQKTLPG